MSEFLRQESMVDQKMLNIGIERGIQQWIEQGELHLV